MSGDSLRVYRYLDVRLPSGATARTIVAWRGVTECEVWPTRFEEFPRFAVDAAGAEFLEHQGAPAGFEASVDVPAGTVLLILRGPAGDAAVRRTFERGAARP